LISYFFIPQELQGKIRLLISHYNRADFLELQCKAFEKFFVDEYEVIVINDAPDEINEKQIRAVCEKYHLTHVRYEQSWHTTDPLNDQIRNGVDDPVKNSYFLLPLQDGLPDLKAISEQCSIRHCHVIQHGMDLFGYDHDDIVVIMDGDVFPVKTISIRELLTESPIIGIDSEFRGRHYLWVPFIAFDPKRLPNIKDLKFHLDIIDGVLCDTGSHSYHYLKNNPEVSYRLYPRRTDYDFYPWDSSAFLNFGFDSPGINKLLWPVPFEFYVDYHFVHYVGGSAHIPSVKKLQAINELLNCVLRH
jgi:hypothetical protein